MKKYITSFIFDKAQYYVTDEKENTILLKINYKENNFIIEREKETDKKFVREIREVAKELLKKKHGVNRAEFL